MNRTAISVPEIAIIGGTRAALGAGVGLLLAGHLNDDQRRAAGWALFTIGALSTIPILMQLRKSFAATQNRPASRNPAQFIEEEQYA